MNRRNFLSLSTLAGAGFAFGHCTQAPKTHFITLSFDDGFKRSCYRIAEIFENHGLSACFNVIASGHLDSFNTTDAWIGPAILGDFDDWNTLKSRGHEVMPHSWEHLNLTKVSLEKAKENVDKCLDYFEANLEGYISGEAVYNFAYNASNPLIEDYILQRTSAVRTGGWLMLKDRRANLLSETKKLGCWGQGPDNCDDYVEKEINDFLNTSGGWLILNLHGLDNEGWGPISTRYLDRLLHRLVRLPQVSVRPAGEILKVHT